MKKPLSVSWGAPGGKNESDEWSTPQHILTAIGPFDLDPCPLDNSIDGLSVIWKGFVWMNPPYSEAKNWLKKMSEHGDGIALVFARTETRYWFDYVWNKADGILFLKGRLRFGCAKDPAPAPSALIAYGGEALYRLMFSGLEGSLVTDWRSPESWDE